MIESTLYATKRKRISEPDHLDSVRRALTPLQTVIEHLKTRLPASVTDPSVDRFSSKLPGGKQLKSQRRSDRTLLNALSEVTADLDDTQELDFKRFIVAKLACELPEVLPDRNLTPNILSLYPAAIDRLIKHIEFDTGDQYPSDNDFLLKDFRFALALSVPCGAQEVTLYSRISRGSLVKGLFAKDSALTSVRLLGTIWTDTWYRGHMDARFLDDFSDSGFKKYFLRVADLLKLHENVRGLVHTSWLLDPQLEEISPWLAHLTARQLEGGATLLRHGPAEEHTRNATEASKSRSRLVEEGKYIPVGYSTIWSRNSLIRWSESM